MSFEIPKIKCGVLTDSRLKDSEEERKGIYFVNYFWLPLRDLLLIIFSKAMHARYMTGIPAAKIQSAFKAMLEAEEELKGTYIVRCYSPRLFAYENWNVVNSRHSNSKHTRLQTSADSCVEERD